MHADTSRVVGIAARSGLVMVAIAMLCTVLMLPRTASAQDSPRVEIGTSIGATIISTSGGGGSDTHFGIPGGIGPLSPFSPAIYATIFAGPSFIVEPQVSLSALSGGGSTTTFFTLLGQVGYLFMGNEASSPYLAIGGAIQNASGGGSSVSGTAFGGEAGYRIKAGSSMAVRMKLSFRRWFSDFADTNEIGVGIGFGGVL